MGKEMERRESIRLPVNVPVLVEFPEGGFSNCIITDTSAGGIFIKFKQTDINKDTSPALLDKSIGDVILVKTSDLSTMVRIVRKTDIGMGATIYLTR